MSKSTWVAWPHRNNLQSKFKILGLPPIIANIPADELPQHHGVRCRRHINNKRDTRILIIQNAVDTIMHVKITSGRKSKCNKEF